MAATPSAQASTALISVKGPREAHVSLCASDTCLTGSFWISLMEHPRLYQEAQRAPNGGILYRLRVREQAIIFSKTYGLLSFDIVDVLPGEAVAILAPRSTFAEVPDIALPLTIRVEYLVLSEDEVAEVQDSLEKEVCRPFFSRKGVQVYDVQCALDFNEEKRHRNPHGDASATPHGRAPFFTAVAIVAAAGLGIAALGLRRSMLL